MEASVVKRETMGLSELTDLGGIIAKCGYFRDARDYSQAVVKVLAGRELGLPPIASLMGLYFVNGKLGFSATLMGALIKKSGRYDYEVGELTDTGCTVIVSANGKVLGKSTFTLKDAEKAGLNRGDNWQKYPRNMLFARALSNAARWFCADVFGGAVYTPEELGAAVDAETGEPLNPGAPAEIEEPAVPAPLAPSDLRDQLFDRIKALRDEHGVTVERIRSFARKTFGSGRVEDLPAEKVQEIVEWLEGLSGNREPGDES